VKLSDQTSALKGVGPELSKKLATLGIETIEQLLDYLPRRYDDYSIITPIAKLQPGVVTVEAEIKQAVGRYVRRGMHITEAVASDETGSVRLVWFNQPYRAGGLKTGERYFISGEFGFKRQRMSLQNPSVELASDFPINTARIVPVYRETKGLKSHQIRKLIRACSSLVTTLPETLPLWMLKKHKLMAYAEAVMTMHFPSTADKLVEAKRRLGFEEVLHLTLASLLNKQELMQEVALSIPFNKKLAQAFVSNLPFTLTVAQRKAIWQVYLDMEKSQPMNRLIEGDVGSGKTVVAAMAAVMAMKEGFQVALMAPTELLARQHAETLFALLQPLGMAEKMTLLVGGLKSDQKKSAHTKIASGDVMFVVGTHALIQDKVDMHKLGLVIIDEQHRFGVEQRKALLAKAGHAPHVLSLTATPIPRSLALTLFGELDISVIDVKPAGRKPILTKITSPNSRAQLYAEIEKQLEAGRQMFVVCPLVKDSASLEASSAESVFTQLSTKDFKNWRIGLLHGKMKADEKEAVMKQFVAHKLDILVSTTVIEVGVNVPNATVMLVENAERFGLAQIHQLRGRVGRSDEQGYCYLMMGDSSAPSRRLRALESSQDGFALAELDLEIRGPGAIYGSMQHGILDLRVAKLSDVTLIASARTAAQEFIDSKEDLLQYTQMAARVQKLRAVTSLN
jgi:ATP-dependent DNA helicase RecG